MPSTEDVEQGGEVRAAGGLVWRAGGPEGIELLVVHRPRYDDWTLPKGKLEPGESWVDAAQREVGEETGLRGALGPELPSTRYTDHRGRPKLVRYWAMEVEGGAFAPNDEVDEVDWMAPTAARSRLSYERDRTVVACFLART